VASYRRERPFGLLPGGEEAEAQAVPDLAALFRPRHVEIEPLKSRYLRQGGPVYGPLVGEEIDHVSAFTNACRAVRRGPRGYHAAEREQGQ